uniref:Uncharacterized protein n=1 Tax=Sus scrofa TaxID=9823 RepID=A0A4X1VNE0_PIG
MYTYFIIWDYNPILCYLFGCSNYPSFGRWDLFQVGSCFPLACPILLFFVSFLTFWCYKIFQAYL